MSACLKHELVIALDVGGTFIKGSVMEHGVILTKTISQYDSRAHEDRETLLQHFVDIMMHLLLQYAEHNGQQQAAAVAYAETILRDRPLGIGVAFPGPFDYEQGICYIQDLGKFESLYGVNVYDELIQRIIRTYGTKRTNLSIHFENDGRLFGLGASTLYPDQRLICLTLGTGLGSAFIDNGRMITDRIDVPEDGYLYHRPFQDRIADDRFSRRGILKTAANLGIDAEGVDVKELASMTRCSDYTALTVFQQFGTDLGSFLLPYCTAFRADRIIIGGQIAKSYDLFELELSAELQQCGVQISTIDDALQYTFLGIYQLLTANSE